MMWCSSNPQPWVMPRSAGRCMQEFQLELAKLQEFPWTVATGDDEKHLRALGKLPPKESSKAEAFVNW